jgi:hypothetical protein
MPRLSQSERKTALEQKRKQIAAQIKAIDARNNKLARNDDTRRKVIAGALALEHMDKNQESAFAGILRDLLERYADPRARYLFPFITQGDAKAEVTKRVALPPANKADKGKPSPPPPSSASPDATAPPPAPVAEKLEPQPAPAPAPAPLPATPQPQAAPAPSHPAASHPPGQGTTPGGFASMFKK